MMYMFKDGQFRQKKKVPKTIKVCSGVVSCSFLVFRRTRTCKLQIHVRCIIHPPAALPFQAVLGQMAETDGWHIAVWYVFIFLTRFTFLSFSICFLFISVSSLLFLFISYFVSFIIVEVDCSHCGSFTLNSGCRYPLVSKKQRGRAGTR